MNPEHNHNHWETWSYWAKGGSISIAVALGFIVFQLVLVPHVFYKTCGTVACMMPVARFIENIFTNSLMPLWSSPLANLMLNYQFIYVLAALAYYFFIGAFIGLMIEKRKKR